MSDWGDHVSVWWDALVHPEKAGRLVLGWEERRGFTRFLVLGITFLYLAYGFPMGLFRGTWPGIVSGLKLPVLYLFTIVICYPAFYVLNCLIGPRLSRIQCLRLLLMAVSVNAAALASYAPIALFFTLTTSAKGYGFLVLMHVGVFAVAGILSLIVISMLFRATAAELGHRIRPLMVIGWGILYAFVGTQLSWVLRPWIGSLAIPYTPFRPLEGSFIEAVTRLIMAVLGD